jgi:hypothetical protein
VSLHILFPTSARSIRCVCRFTGLDILVQYHVKPLARSDKHFMGI